MDIFFVAAAAAFALSLPFNPYPEPNIFSLTSSRFVIPTDVLFSRLARLRPMNVLTEEDTLLQTKFSSPAARRIYLRFGTDALISCPYCSFDSPKTFILYYLPFNIVLPHLLQLLIIGIATSSTLVGEQAAKWRGKFVSAAVVFALIDASIVSFYDPTRQDIMSGKPPVSYHNAGFVGRLLAIAVFNSICAGLVYLSTTKRLFYTVPSQSEQAEQAVATATSALLNSTSKLHALSVVRNAVVRDRLLRNRDDTYWRVVTAMEGDGSVGSIWEEEEVARAITNVLQSQGKDGAPDVTKIGVDANTYVDGITKDLELTE